MKNQDGLIEGEELREFCSLISIAQPRNATPHSIARSSLRDDGWFILAIWEDDGCHDHFPVPVSYRKIRGCLNVKGKPDSQKWPNNLSE